MSKVYSGQFASAGGRFGVCVVFISLSPCSSASQQLNHCVFLASCDLRPCVRGEHSRPWGLSSSMAFLQEVDWLCCKGSAALPSQSRPAGWLQDPSGIPTPSGLAPLKGEYFKKDAGFCTWSLGNLRCVLYVTTGREMRINRCLWLYCSESCYTAWASLGSVPVTGSAQPCPCWRRHPGANTETTEHPQLLQSSSVSLPPD